MKNKSKIIIGILVLGLAAMACTTTGFGRQVRGNGRMKDEVREIGDFERVAFSGIGNIKIEQNDTTSLEVEAESNLLEYIETYVKGETLYIEIKDGTNFLPTEGITFRLSTPTLAEVTVSGLGNISVESFTADTFEISISGGGDVSFEEINADRVNVKVSGLGNLDIKDGQAERLDITISGGGDINTLNFECERVNVDISGLGNAKVWANQLLDVTISGGGSVKYAGNPEISQDISGLGELVDVND